MNFKRKTERGQAIILVVLGIVALIGLTALAIDAGNAFSDRRNAQNAADTAAFAAVLEKIEDTPSSDGDGITWSGAGLARASSNGYTNDGVHNTVAVNNPPIAGCNGTNGLYAGNTEYYQVIIRSNVDTFFAPIVGIDQLHNCVEAIAHFKPGVYTSLALGNAIAAVSCTGKDTIIASGSTTVTLIGSGAFSNSTNAEALFVQKLANLVTPEDKGLQSVGGIAAPYGYPSPITTGLQQFPCPLPSYMLPSYTCNYNYNDFPPSDTDANVTITGSGSNTMATLHAGVYCISGSFSKTGMRNTTEGIGGVTFVMLNQGFNWNGNVDILINAPTSGSTKGLLIYLPYSNSSTITFNGTAGLNISGSVYAPASTINLTGDFGNSAILSQWVGAKIDMSGNLKATIQFDAGLNYEFPAPPVIELSK